MTIRTWKEFKDKIEEHTEVTDATKIHYIDLDLFTKIADLKVEITRHKTLIVS